MLDIGCGFGDTTQQLAHLVGPAGSAVGGAVGAVRGAAVQEASEAGAKNVEFLAGDVQVMDLPGPFDHAFSRDGRDVLRQPGGRVSQHPLRARAGRPALRGGVAAQDRQRVAVSRRAGGGPLPRGARGDGRASLWTGAFSMADPDTVSEQLLIAGFEEPTFTRCDIPLKVGSDLDQPWP